MKARRRISSESCESSEEDAVAREEEKPNKKERSAFKEFKVLWCKSATKA